MNLKQKAVTRRKKINAAATYLYQADCDGEWGEVYIDFANKKAKIIQLADWDLTRFRVYARTAICHLISQRNANPEGALADGTDANWWLRIQI